MKKRLALIATVVTALVGVAAGSAVAGDRTQDRLHDGSCGGVPTQSMDQDHLHIHR